MTPLEQFDAALAKGAVTSERAAVYDHPAVHFAKTGHLTEVIQSCPDRRIRHALYMILDKISRLTKTPDHLDSIIDIAGYARTMAMILEHDKKRAAEAAP